MSQELVERTKKFAVAIIGWEHRIARSTVSDVIWRQLLRASLSIGANYRAACCARSRAEFIAKLQIAREEADESQYWLGLLRESDSTLGEFLSALQQEAAELTAILTVSIATAKRHAKPQTR